MIAIHAYFCPECGKGYESKDCVEKGKGFQVWKVLCPDCSCRLEISGWAFILTGFFFVYLPA